MGLRIVASPITPCQAESYWGYGDLPKPGFEAGIGSSIPCRRCGVRARPGVPVTVGRRSWKSTTSTQRTGVRSTPCAGGEIWQQSDRPLSATGILQKVKDRYAHTPCRSPCRSLCRSGCSSISRQVAGRVRSQALMGTGCVAIMFGDGKACRGCDANICQPRHIDSEPKFSRTSPSRLSARTSSTERRRAPGSLIQTCCA